jgi:hypothetical protein
MALGIGLFALYNALYHYWYSAGEYLDIDIRRESIAIGSVWFLGFLIFVGQFLKFITRYRVP